MSGRESEAIPKGDVIAARGLTKRYGGVSAVDAINFEILKGEVFGLLGPNGAGKTTTILMMLGLTDISSGRVSVLGHDPARAPLQVKRRVGYLPDSVGFYEHLTAVENLSYTAKLMGLPFAERARRIAAALARVSCSMSPTSASRRFRAACVSGSGSPRSSSSRPRSPFSTNRLGLDPQATHEFLGLIGELKAEGVTVLVSSHLLDQVQRVCNRVALFQAGRIVLMGPVPISPVRCSGRLRGGGRGRWRRACPAARHHTRGDQRRNAGGRPLSHDGRPGRAAGRGARRRRRERIAAPAFGR